MNMILECTAIIMHEIYCAGHDCMLYAMHNLAHTAGLSYSSAQIHAWNMQCCRYLTHVQCM